MEFIKPNAEIWEQGNTLEDIWAHIARCTRVCYQSTPKENGETDEEFVKRVILHNGTQLDFEKLHGAMLEHGTVYLIAPNHSATAMNYDVNKYSKVVVKDCKAYITTNLRVIYENNLIEDLEHVVPPTEHHIKRITVSFITNIGITREFNRHRVDSIAEESTRYCNYSKKNDGHLKIGLPAWLLDDGNISYLKAHRFDSISEYAEEILANEDATLLVDWSDMDFYLCSLTFSQWCYNMLIKKGWSAQRAREVLPLATKSQLIHTAFIDDWKHFFNLRAIGVSGAPHPNAELVAKPLYEEFIKRGYIE